MAPPSASPLAAGFVAVVALTQGFGFLGEGLSPEGLVVPWLARLTSVAIAVPVLTTASVGAAAGAFWLRHRAPVKDRNSLGPLGSPMLALVAAAALLVGGALCQALLPGGVALALLAMLDVVALLWLRQLTHLGLMGEASEIAIGPEAVCANCGGRTATHTFCSNCGISLRALPKAPAGEVPTSASAIGDAPA